MHATLAIAAGFLLAFTASSPLADEHKATPAKQGKAAHAHDDHGGHAGPDSEAAAAPPAAAPDSEAGHGHAAPAGAGASHGSPQAHAPLRILVKGALERLKEGNQRYVNDKPANPRRSKERRLLVAKTQIPFAVVVGCADSRVPPEILFDQGLGDLFVIRVAGNVLDDPTLGSIEYAVEHLGTRLIVVLGHERCGAVAAACKGGDPGAHVSSLVNAIKPAVDAARKKKGDLLTEAVSANVRMVTDQLRGSWPILAPMVREDELAVVGAVYDLDNGAVEFFE